MTKKFIAAIALGLTLAIGGTSAAIATPQNIIEDAMGIVRTQDNIILPKDQKKILKQLRSEFDMKIGFCQSCGQWTTEYLGQGLYLCGICQDCVICPKCEELAMDCSHWKKHWKKWHA